ncbi:ABC transporter ATP-binding protein [Butyrivibrio sp. INlla16]|uniref:ABC transporter ATP-binding protein n=1 Tax=Butyrivibrio sp. INlla16 TaxID=1520807 RepID=UPI00088DB5DD|nr:ABC transporter ATP-binding protein [Butyrivibrio sp. INlla16]SDB11362.1 ABC-2 type transport system ATP-binding protein [Butyrivibrio sp. INlla16]
MVKVDNLVKNYGSFRLDVSMEIPDGTVTGIVGKNGAGKSTTIKSILGLVKPDGGHVTINGKEASKLTAKDKEEIGVALSDSGFSTFLTVKDITAIMKKMYPSFNEEVFRRNCSSQRLPFDKAIKEFSTGMRAKLRVLIAMSHNARILIMDEPTAGLDVEARNDILDLLREYLVEDEKRSILITSHISSDLEGLCDDIYLIHDGKVILHEDTDAILGNYGVLKVNEATYEKLDKSYILSTKKDHFGYACFTNEKQFYAENNPNIVIENSDIDDLILMMTGGN